MAFIDNSKDIIIDAVLTDLGRKRMAEGTFNITRFALGDDEINYGLYNPNLATSYQDLELLQTPVFEAFTNNVSTMNNRLVTYTNNNLLYLPILKLNSAGVSQNTLLNNGSFVKGGVQKTDIVGITNVFLVAVDEGTRSSLNNNNKIFINGQSATANTDYIRIDQGIDNSARPSSDMLESDLVEEQYTVEIDDRFGKITFNNSMINPTYIDDDNVALYSFNLFSQNSQVSLLAPFNVNNPSTNIGHVLAGARGSVLQFGIYANTQLSDTSNYFFNTFGSTVNVGISGTWKIIHTTVTVTGLKTGYSLDIPVSFIKKIN